MNAINDVAGRVPPQAVDIEKSVLAECLESAKAREQVFTMLTPADFYSPTHEKIYSAMLALDQQGSSIDCVTVINELRRQKKLNVTEDQVYIVGLHENFVSDANAGYHARIVLEKSLQRKFIVSCAVIVDDAYTPEADIYELLEKYNQAGDEISAVIGRNSRKCKIDLLNEYATYLLTNSKNGVQRIATPYPTLTRMLKGGFEYGGFSLIGGLPGTGKTSFMLALAHHAAKCGIRTSFIEGEMPSNELLERLNGIATENDIDIIRKGEQFETRSREFISSMYNMPLEVVITPERTLTHLVDTVRQEIRDGSKLVFIDYLQVFASKTTSEKEFQEIKRVSETLRALSLRYGVHLCVASALNRRENDSTRLTLGSLYGSSGLGHDATVVFMLSGEQQDLNELKNPIRSITLSVVKNRSGVRGDIALTYYLDSQRIEETGVPTATGVTDNVFTDECENNGF